jgi:hypothetical protein
MASSKKRTAGKTKKSPRTSSSSKPKRTAKPAARAPAAKGKAAAKPVAKATKRPAASKSASARRKRKTPAPRETAPTSESRDLVICGAHGETPATFVCRHLADGVARGFHADAPTKDQPWPDAWCDECDKAFQAGGGEWNEETEKVLDIKVLCTHCYGAAKERNSSTTGFTCDSCGEWHDSLPRDLGFDEPMYVDELDDEQRSAWVTGDGNFRVRRSPDETNYFIRGVIELPIAGTKDSFCYGVWTSLSEPSYLAATKAATADEEAGPFFGWLSNIVPGYPTTQNLKTHVHLRPGLRAAIELEPTDHPLAVEQREGITVERWKQIVAPALHTLN